MSEGGGSFSLTKEERERIMAGDYAALKRDEDPGAELEGETVPLRRRKAHLAPVYSIPKFSGQRREIIDTQEVPEYVSAWIELGKPTRHRSGGWCIPFTFHDDGQHDRTLRAGGPPGPPKEAGLRTRELEKPRPKGEGVGRFTDESARGYGAGGDQALDRGGVDDGTLAQFAAEGVQRDLAREEESNRAMMLEARLAQARAECRRRGVDTSRLDASIEKRIRAYERRLKDAA